MSIDTIITILTLIVVPCNFYAQWQLSKGNLKIAYPLLMWVYTLYITVETILAFNDPSQISILLFNVVNIWSFIMAFRGMRRIRQLHLPGIFTRKELTMYVYSAKLLRVVDGDTLDLEVDLGFRTFHQIRARLHGVDTPEIYGVKKESEEYQKGQEASQYVRDWFGNLGSETFIVETIKDKQGKYGRYLVKVLSMDQSKVLNEDLVANGHAVEVHYD